MPRAVWKGSICFGLINIPIAVHPAVRDTRPRFRLLHKSDLSPIRLDQVCQEEGTRIEPTEVVKGYEYDPGKFVVVNEEDFQAAVPRKTRTIDILDFVPEKDIDDRFFDVPYYLVPAKGGERAYALLREALRGSGRVGLAKIILRDAQHLAALVVVEDALVLALLRFGDELVDPGQFTFPEAREVQEDDLLTARALVDRLTEPFEPGRYADEYRQNLQRIIRAKVKGKKPELEEPERLPKEAEVISLMERLRRSLLPEGEGPKKRPAPPASPASPASEENKGEAAAS